MNQLRIIIMSTAIMLSVAAFAQNEIDRVVDQFSTIGSSTFTSAVERDPHTRRVIKTVKVLETSYGPNVSKLKNAFEKEANTGNFSTKKEDNETKMILTVQTERTNRIYMLNFTSHHNIYSGGKATIIVKVRQKQKNEKNDKL